MQPTHLRAMELEHRLPYEITVLPVVHPTQVNAPRLTSARKAGTRFTYPGGMEDCVDQVAGYIAR